MDTQFLLSLLVYLHIVIIHEYTVLYQVLLEIIKKYKDYASTRRIITIMCSNKFH